MVSAIVRHRLGGGEWLFHRLLSGSQAFACARNDDPLFHRRLACSADSKPDKSGVGVRCYLDHPRPANVNEAEARLDFQLPETR